jgi:hypothetical protein
MAYQYTFDRSHVGDWRWFRSSYQLVQESLIRFLMEIKNWNEVAVQHGAARRPYEKEENDISRMVAWGTDRLKESSGADIEINGITVGSLRYKKAALLLSIYLREQDLQSRRRDAWPSGALQSLEESVQKLRDLADKIKLPPAELLWQLMPKTTETNDTREPVEKWDVFISHASEDKDNFVRPLASALQKRELRVWFDESTLTVGDSLRRSIDRGLAQSRYGIVVISPDFLKKEWPQKELDALVALEVGGRKVVLPVWHNVDAAVVRNYSPLLADRLATSSAKGLDVVVSDLIKAMI